MMRNNSTTDTAKIENRGNSKSLWRYKRYSRKTWYADIFRFLCQETVQNKIKIGEGQVEKSQFLSVLTWTIRYIKKYFLMIANEFYLLQH
jgi:hypothetical protein